MVETVEIGKGLAEALAKAYADVRTVEATGVNQAEGFKYATAADLSKACGDALAENGLFVVPLGSEDMTREDVAGAGYYSRIAGNMRFLLGHCGGEGIVAAVPFVAGSRSNKEASKACTQALKYLMRLALMPEIEVGEWDEGTDNGTDIGEDFRSVLSELEELRERNGVGFDEMMGAAGKILKSDRPRLKDMNPAEMERLRIWVESQGEEEGERNWGERITKALVEAGSAPGALPAATTAMMGEVKTLGEMSEEKLGELEEGIRVAGAHFNELVGLAGKQGMSVEDLEASMPSGIFEMKPSEWAEMKELLKG